ncbi:hypothetical protein FWF74_00885 [Candidatus Saccharibacteria bacterium]|nr:hypothetical protein [Candidatus Saccharibacteria bacterium]MCL1962989.1 hypothetical protein [Candidatus Saccharibacteria bacterium]
MKSTKNPLLEKFCYVSQDNYLFCRPETDKLGYIYSDSATSCIILVVVGKDKAGETLVALAHLSQKARFEAFFEMIEREFAGGVAIYAQGANPASEAVENANILSNWIAEKTRHSNDQTATSEMFIEQCMIALGLSDSDAGFGQYGVNVDPRAANYLKVSNKYFEITPEIRDPEGGVQTLFCIFGMPELVLHDAKIPFTAQEKDMLIEKARKANWTKLLEYKKDELLQKCSTTPDFEPAWFCDALIESAKLVRDYR